MLYIDIDVHHGDAAQDAFFQTNRVYTLSFHKFRDGYFPGTGALHKVGAREGKNYCLNVPLQDGIRDQSYVGLFTEIVKIYRPPAL